MLRNDGNRQALAALSAAALLIFLAAPALALDIPAGDDPWNTPGGGQTTFTMPGADLDTICGIGGNVNTQITLKGQNLSGQGTGDIVVHRGANIDFDERATGSQTVKGIPLTVTDLHFVSASSISSTCGALNFDVTLDNGGPQPVTLMDVTLDADHLGGSFDADIALNVVYQAKSGGVNVGPPMPYSGTLLNPAGGTPWGYTPPSNPFNPAAPWFPGVTKAGDRVNVLRLYSDPEFQAKHLYNYPKPPPQPCPTTDTTSDGTKATTVIIAEPCPQPTEPTSTEL